VVTLKIRVSFIQSDTKFPLSGYERELNYRRSDKSFSAWGETRAGSTWLVHVLCFSSQETGEKNLVLVRIGRIRDLDWTADELS